MKLLTNCFINLKLMITFDQTLYMSIRQVLHVSKIYNLSIWLYMNCKRLNKIY